MRRVSGQTACRLLRRAGVCCEEWLPSCRPPANVSPRIAVLGTEASIPLLRDAASSCVLTCSAYCSYVEWRVMGRMQHADIQGYQWKRAAIGGSDRRALYYIRYRGYTSLTSACTGLGVSPGMARTHVTSVAGLIHGTRGLSTFPGRRVMPVRPHCHSLVSVNGIANVSISYPVEHIVTGLKREGVRRV